MPGTHLAWRIATLRPAALGGNQAGDVDFGERKRMAAAVLHDEARTTGLDRSVENSTAGL